MWFPRGRAQRYDEPVTGTLPAEGSREQPPFFLQRTHGLWRWVSCQELLPTRQRRCLPVWRLSCFAVEPLLGHYGEYDC